MNTPSQNPSDIKGWAESTVKPKPLQMNATETTTQVTPPINLGWSNDWVTIMPPPLYVICRDKKHVWQSELIGNCQRKYTCDVCNITWKEDSGD